jgi:uncharacterized protein
VGEDASWEEDLRKIYAETHTIAVVGASNEPDKSAHIIPAYLKEQGFRIIPVNPRGGTILGEPAVVSLAKVTEPIDVVEVFRPPEEGPDIARQAAAAGAGVLWFQPGTGSEEAADIAQDAGLLVVMEACMGTMHGYLGLGPGPPEP